MSNGTLPRQLLATVLVWSVGFVVAPWPIANAQQPAKTQEPLAVGEKAPDFELPIQGEDAYLTLSNLVADGPVVVIVLRGYPGYQCPVCSRQVGLIINRAQTLSRALGSRPHRVVLVYPGEEQGLERQAKSFLGARRLPDPLVLVRDPGMEMIQSWGLRWNAARETAYPAAYLIGAGSRVKWAKVSDSHGGRASVEEVLQAIRKL